MKAAVIQFNATADKKNNIRRAKDFVLEAVSQKARWILLPEIFNCRADVQNTQTLKGISEDIPGETTSEFIPLAEAHHVDILLGSLFEKASEEKSYNTSIAIKANGEIVKYRKINLFEAVLGDKIVHENIWLAAGTQGQTVLIDDFKVGLSICYDLRFPQMYQSYAQNGAVALTVPSCFTKVTGQAHWEALLKARAIENLCYVLAPNQVGRDARGMEAYGHSMIVSPWGEILAQASADQEEIIYADLSLEKIQEARRKLPGLFSASGGK